jgi:hypothetical protein
MKFKKPIIISIIVILGVTSSYFTYASFFGQSSAQAKGLVGHWSLSDEDELFGDELHTSANAANIDSEADATTGWTNAGLGTFASSATQANTGSNSLHFVANSGGDQGYTSVSVTSGKRYRVSIFGYLSAGDTGRIRLGTVANDQTYGFGQITSAAWTEYTLDFTASAGNLFVTMIEDGSNNNTDIYLDSLTIKEIHVADLTPNSNNGTVYGATYTTDRNSQSNKAMIFDGSNDYINIDGIITDIVSDTAGTWAAWVKPDDGHPDAVEMFITVGDTNADEFVDFYYRTDGKLEAFSRDGGVNQWDLKTDNPIFTDGAQSTYTHVALVQDGTAPVFYVNGVLVAATFTINTDTTDWMSTLTGLDNARIGSLNKNSAGETNHFDGSISDVRIYSRALSAEEIQDLYGSYNPVLKTSSIAKGLVGRWTLGEDEDKTVNISLDNNGFEDGDATSWDTQGSPSTNEVNSTAAFVHSGAYSWHIVSDANNEGRSYTYSGDFVGKHVRVMAWVYVVSGKASLDIRKAFNGSEYVFDQDHRTDSTTTGKWEKLVVEGIAGVNSFLIRVDSNDASEEFYIDDLYISEIQVADQTINENDGTYTGTTTAPAIYTTDRHSQSNKAMSFDGTNDHIQFAGISLLDPMEAFTFSAWIKNTDGASDTIYAAGDNSDTTKPYFRIFCSPTTFGIPSRNDANSEPTVSSTLARCSKNEWHHVVVLNDGSENYLFYVDGIGYAATTNTMTGTYNNLDQSSIGRLWRGASSYGSSQFDGSISDVRIYNRALTAEEIGDLYGQYNPVVKTSSLTKGLVGSWSLSDTDEVVGAEMVTNGTFDSDVASWTEYQNGLIAWNAGKGDLSALTTNPDMVRQTVGLTDGQSYRLSYVISNLNGGSAVIQTNYSNSKIGGGDHAVTISADGQFSSLVEGSASAEVLDLGRVLSNGTERTLTYDNVSVKPLLAGDLTPNENNGTVHGGAYTTDRNGQSNKAMDFDGTADYINIDGIISEIASDTEGTWSAWVKPDEGFAVDSSEMFISVGDTNADEFMDFYYRTDGKLEAFSRDGGVNQWDLKTDNPIFTNESQSKYTHVALVQNGTAPVFYVNGELAASTLTITTDTTDWMATLTGLDNVRIGTLNKNSAGETNHFDGSMLDARIYNRALTAEEVGMLYKSY